MTHDGNTCEKCGHESASFRWEAADDMIRRTCVRCEYQWLQLPVHRRDEQQGDKRQGTVKL